MRPDPNGRRTAATELQREYAARLRRARLAAGFKTQKALADYIGVNEDVLAHWERGRNYPTRAEEVRLVDAIGVTLDWLHRGRTDTLHPDIFKRIREVVQ